MERNEKNNFRILFSSFWSFNGGNGKSISWFGSLSGTKNGMGKRKYSFISIPLKPQIFFPPKLGGIGGNEIRFNEVFTKTPKMPLYIQPFILK